jgi:hypothetical protein
MWPTYKLISDRECIRLGEAFTIGDADLFSRRQLRA